MPISLASLRSAAQRAVARRFAGHLVTIENTAGSRRRPEWPPLTADYGYFVGAPGADKDHIDVFMARGLVPNWDGPAFVVDQYVDGEFDEHKVMLGWWDEWSARLAYKSNYAPGWQGLGAITRMSMQELEQWLKNGDKTMPVHAIIVPVTKEFSSPGGATTGLAGYALDGQRPGARLRARRARAKSRAKTN